MSLKSRAIRGSAFTVVGYMASQLLRVGSNLALTRLLFPEAFGLMALVQAVMMGLVMVSDVGTRQSIIRDERGDEPSFLNTAWTIQVIRGFILWPCGILLAWPFARFYGEPQLGALISVAAAAAALGGLTSTKLASLNRRMAVGRIVMIDLGAQAASIITMIGFALVYRSVWALVAGGLISSLSKMLLSHFAIFGVRNRFQWDRAAVRTIVTFGKWIFLSTLVTFLAMRLDVFLLGKLVPIDILGVYSIAWLLAMIPQQVAGRLAETILFPALSESTRRGKEVLSANLQRARCVLLPAAMLGVVGIALLAPAFFYYLYDVRYHDAGWMAQLLMVTVWFYFLHHCAARALLAVGDSRFLAVGNAARLVCAALGCVAGYRLAGLPGFILGVSAGSLAGYVVLAAAMVRHGLFIAAEDLRYTSAGIACGVIGVCGQGYAARILGIEDVMLAGVVLAAPILVSLGLFAALRSRAELI
jgi:O-antigen/teichoic acid export membrane protein